MAASFFSETVGQQTIPKTATVTDVSNFANFQNSSPETSVNLLEHLQVAALKSEETTVSFQNILKKLLEASHQRCFQLYFIYLYK